MFSASTKLFRKLYQHIYLHVVKRYHVGWHDTMSRLCGREFEVVATLDKAKGVRIQDGFAVFALPFSGVEVVGVPRSLSRNSSPTSVGTGTGPNTLARHSTV